MPIIRSAALAVLTALLAAPLSAQTRPTVTGLLTEYRANPLGTDVVKPRLSWRIESTRRNTMQAAYQIQVGTSQAALTAGKSLLWDSGRITTDASIFRPYDGPAPTSATRYYWRVRVWDDAGNPSAWSNATRARAAWRVMGMGNSTPARRGAASKLLLGHPGSTPAAQRAYACSHCTSSWSRQST